MNECIPNGWGKFKLKEILARVRNPVEVKGDAVYREIGIRSHGKGIFHKEEIIGEKLGNKSVFWVEPNCFIVNIVFAWELAVAKTTSYESGFIASHRFPMYQAKGGKSDVDFITYFFNTSNGKYLLNLASPGGAGRNKTLGQGDFLELEVVIPKNVDEQQKIASILSTWDKAIELQEKLIEQKREQKKGLMQKLLTGEMRLPGFDGGWRNVKVKDIANIYLGLTYTPKYVNKGIPFLSVKDLDGDKLNFGNVKYISKTEFESSTSNAKPQKGDVLFGRVGTLGNPVVITEDVEFCIFVSLGFLRMLNDSVSNYFVKYWMQTDQFDRQIESKIAGSSQKNLNTGWFKEFELSIPSIEEQKAIVAILLKADKEISLLHKEVKLLHEQKKGHMQLLLTGKVRVKV